MGFSENALFLNGCISTTQILMYSLCTAIIRAVLPFSYKKITIFRDVLKLYILKNKDIYSEAFLFISSHQIVLTV